MQEIALRAAAWYLPDQTLSVSDLPELRALPEAERDTCLGLGIDQILADDQLTAVDLAERAARLAMAQIGLSHDDIDALIMIESRAPRHLIASEATQLQARLCANRAVTFSVGGLGCVSITPALLVARGLLAADPEMSCILVVHGSKPATHRRYRHPVTVSGDGGQAIVVARQGPVRIRDIIIETSGHYWDLFRVDYQDRPSAEWFEECTNMTEYSFKLAVETRNRLRALNNLALKRNNVSQKEVLCHVSQNLSAATFRIYEEWLGIEIADVCRDNLRRFGHLGPNDVLLNLYSAMRHGQLPDGASGIVLNAAPTAAWSVLLVENRDHTKGEGTAHFL